jgi:hypothetical protein
MKVSNFIDINKNVLTIEMNPQSKTINQIRGKFNRKPTNSEMNIISKWVLKNNLTISNYLY